MNRIVRRRFAQSAAPLLAAFAIACATAHEPVSPMEGVAGEVLDVQIAQRVRSPGERLPSTLIASQRGSVTVDVVRTQPFCAPLVGGVVLRGSGVLDVVTSVGGSPYVLCSLIANSVLTYRVVVPRVSAGRVTVRLFERIGEDAPTFRAQRTVVVPD